MTTLRERFLEFWVEEHGSAPETHWIICPDCRGEGTTTRHLGAFTQADREEMGEEWYDFIDDVRAGVYDQPCDGCGGSGKVKEFADPDVLQAWSEWEHEDYLDRRTRMHEDGIYCDY